MVLFWARLASTICCKSLFHVIHSLHVLTMMSATTTHAMRNAAGVSAFLSLVHAVPSSDSSVCMARM